MSTFDHFKYPILDNHGKKVGEITVSTELKDSLEDIFETFYLNRVTVSGELREFSITHVPAEEKKVYVDGSTVEPNTPTSEDMKLRIAALKVVMWSEGNFPLNTLGDRVNWFNDALHQLKAKGLI